MGFDLTPKPPTFDPSLLGPMQELWEGSPELSVSQIGARLGVTKNVVMGQAHRRGWVRAGSEPAPSLFAQRMDALHAGLDTVLAETRAHVEDRPKVYAKVDVNRRRRWRYGSP